jgi:hypothetical protein
MVWRSRSKEKSKVIINSQIYVSTKEDKYTLFQGLRFKAVADYTYHNGMALFFGAASNESNMY